MNIEKSPLGILKAAAVLAALLVVVKLGWMGAQYLLNLVSAGTGDKARGALGI